MILSVVEMKCNFFLFKYLTMKILEMMSLEPFFIQNHNTSHSIVISVSAYFFSSLRSSINFVAVQLSYLCIFWLIEREKERNTIDFNRQLTNFMNLSLLKGILYAVSPNSSPNFRFQFYFRKLLFCFLFQWIFGELKKHTERKQLEFTQLTANHFSSIYKISSFPRSLCTNKFTNTTTQSKKYTKL